MFPGQSLEQELGYRNRGSVQRVSRNIRQKFDDDPYAQYYSSQDTTDISSLKSQRPSATKNKDDNIKERAAGIHGQDSSNTQRSNMHQMSRSKNHISRLNDSRNLRFEGSEYASDRGSSPGGSVVSIASPRSRGSTRSSAPAAGVPSINMSHTALPPRSSIVPGRRSVEQLPDSRAAAATAAQEQERMYAYEEESPVQWGTDATGLGSTHESFRATTRILEASARKEVHLASVMADSEDRRAALQRLEHEAVLAAQLFADMRGLTCAQAEEVEWLEDELQRTRADVNQGRVSLVHTAPQRSPSLVLAGAAAGVALLGPATLVLAGVKVAAGAALGGALAGALVGRRLGAALARANARSGRRVRRRASAVPQQQDAQSDEDEAGDADASEEAMRGEAKAAAEATPAIDLAVRQPQQPKQSQARATAGTARAGDCSPRHSARSPTAAASLFSSDGARARAGPECGVGPTAAAADHARPPKCRHVQSRPLLHPGPRSVAVANGDAGPSSGRTSSTSYLHVSAGLCDAFSTNSDRGDASLAPLLAPPTAPLLPPPSAHNASSRASRDGAGAGADCGRGGGHTSPSTAPRMGVWAHAGLGQPGASPHRSPHVFAGESVRSVHSARVAPADPKTSSAIKGQLMRRSQQSQQSAPGDWPWRWAWSAEPGAERGSQADTSLDASDDSLDAHGSGSGGAARQRQQQPSVAAQAAHAWAAVVADSVASVASAARGLALSVGEGPGAPRADSSASLQRRSRATAEAEAAMERAGRRARQGQGTQSQSWSLW